MGTIFKLEDRILFEAGAAAEAVEAAQNVQDIQQQQAEQSAAESENDQLVSEAELSAGEDHAEQQASAAGEDSTDAVQESLIEGEQASFARAGGRAISVNTNDSESANDSETSAEANLSVSGNDNQSSEFEQNVNQFAQVEDRVSDLGFVSAMGDTLTVDGGRNDLVIISGSVIDADDVEAALAEKADVLRLDPADSDPMGTINAYLAEHGDTKYDAIHLVTHGNSGYFVLNGTVVDSNYLAENSAAFRELGEHLTADGDILLYGCNTAQGEDGEAFVAELAELTGADVAASTDDVAGVDGDWTLDYDHGLVESVNITVDQYHYSLRDWAVTSLLDNNANGTLRYALTYAQSGDSVTITAPAGLLKLNKSLDIKDKSVSITAQNDVTVSAINMPVFNITETAAFNGEKMTVALTNLDISVTNGGTARAINATGTGADGKLYIELSDMNVLWDNGGRSLMYFNKVADVQIDGVHIDDPGGRSVGRGARGELRRQGDRLVLKLRTV